MDVFTKRVCILATFFTGVVLVVFGVLLTVVIFPDEIRRQVDAGMSLSDNKSLGYKNFVSSE
jgi:hypothetical protein